MPDPTPLSPAAQAIRAAVDAVFTRSPVPPTTEEVAAAVLLAAADQVVPEDPEEAMHFTTEAIRLNRMSVRASFLAIAAELEGHHA